MTDIVVIGHGPSPTGRRWGTQIDQARCVVRMFDSAWQNPFDYGSRYDVGFITLSVRQLQWFHHEANGRRPKAWWSYRQDGNFIVAKTPEPQASIDVSAETAIAKLLDGEGTGGFLTLTRGTAAALTALKLDPKRLILVGFDEVRAGQLSQEPYSESCFDYMEQRLDCRDIRTDMLQRAPGQTKTKGHDLRVEMAVIEAVARVRGVQVLHAQEAYE